MSAAFPMLAVGPLPGWHVSEDGIEAYIRGDLAQHPARVIEEHLACCAECRQNLRETAEFISLVREALLESSAR